MSAIATESLASTVADESTTALVPTVTRIDTRLDVSPISVVLAVSIVCILSPITVTGNSIILAAFYRYKRLRTASNYLLVSLAVSDFGVGVFMPFGMQVELSGLPENGTSTLCILPYCIVIALCSVSVLVTVAIAVDRLTSLAQPLRYKNIITHSSIEKYIAVFWIYATCVGLSPLIYAQVTGLAETHSGGCRFGAAVLPPVRVFLVVAVWAPSALVLLGCYVYVYLVARAHARAIYTVELSFRHQTQTMALPRYGQTLAVTVGAFFILWLPFQTCMLLDIFYGTDFLSEWAVVWLGLPILSHSGANPWIYAFHHGEMRIAAGKIAEDLVALFGVTPSRYGGCSPARRVSNTNLELAEVNNGNDVRRQRVENCFAAKQRSSNTLCSSKRCLDMSGRQGDISPERNETDRSSSSKYYPNEIVGEDIEDLRKMLDPKYIIDRNHVVDSNHNIDKIKNLKYLLDPTFGKIRHLRRLNRKRLLSKNFSKKWSEPKFISYQNLNSDCGPNRKFFRFNAMSDSALNANGPVAERRSKDIDGTLDVNDVEATAKEADTDERGNSNLSSMSYPNIRAASGNASEDNSRVFAASKNGSELVHRYSVQNLSDNGFDERPSVVPQFDRRRTKNRTTRNVYSRARARARFGLTDSTDAIRILNSYSSLSTVESAAKRGLLGSPKGRSSTRSTNLVGNELPNPTSFEPKQRRAAPPSLSKNVELGNDLSPQARTKVQMIHSESVSRIGPSTQRKTFFRNSKLAGGLTIPIIHSEPPSPLEPAPSSSSQEDDPKNFNVDLTTWNNGELESSRNRKSPVRHSDPTLPSVSFNVEDFSEPLEPSDLSGKEVPPETAREPTRLFEALLRNFERSRENKLAEPIFGEHDSTRFDSRRPSDSKWSESSKSQEILSCVDEHRAIPSSYSANDFQTSNSGSDLNDPTSLDPFMCPEPLTSSLRESFFDAPSAPDSDIFTSFEENDPADLSSETDPIRNDLSPVYNSVSAIDLKSSSIAYEQSKSTESVFRGKRTEDGSCTILRLESSPSVHRAKIRMRLYKNAKKTIRLAPLAVPTPTDLSTPTFELVSETKTDGPVLV
ncbi:Adenosine receptor A2b [Vespula squamosa]|uniref:Adenosine receptor A2b n=1 Tax=Vespula squamosa TaxID=30214 RepID=A0ABD1ZSV4_VESSQ